MEAVATETTEHIHEVAIIGAKFAEKQREQAWADETTGGIEDTDFNQA